MNADAFRHLYDYHLEENRILWKACQVLSDEDWVRPSDYSHGSVRDHVLHLVTVDDGWFGELIGDRIPEDPDEATVNDRDRIRALWDEVEGRMRGYLATLRDDQLLGRPWTEGEDKDLHLWQVLIHVVNHGTDHRAQILRQLHDLGVGWGRPQDYAFYAYEHVIA